MNAKSEKALSSPVRLLALAFLGLFMSLCLTGQPIEFKLGPVQTSALEILAAACWVLVLNKVSLRSPLYVPCIVVLAGSLVPLTIGISAHGIERALRDYAQLIYMSFIFVGHFFYRRQLISPRSLLTALCVASVLYSILFLSERYLASSDNIIRYGYFWRVAIALSIIGLLTRVLNSKSGPRIDGRIALPLIGVLLFCAIQIRTRAFLLMILVGASFIVLGSFSVRRRPGELAKVLTIVGLVSIFVVIPIVAGVLSPDLADSGSLKRSVVLLEGDVSADSTASYRILAWATALGGIVQSPLFGQGFGSYVLLDPLLEGDFKYLPSAMIHNTLLQFAYVGGVTFFLANAYLFYEIYRTAGWISHDPTPSAAEGAGAQRILRALLLGFLVYSFFGVTLFETAGGLFFWFLVGYFCQSVPRAGYSVRARIAS